MTVLVGSSVSLEEFEEVDVFISWLDALPSSAKYSVLGTDKFFIVGRYGKEMLKRSDFEVVNILGKKFLVVSGEAALFPELFHFAKKNNATFVVAFNEVQNLIDLSFCKAKFWAHSQESDLVVFSLLYMQGKVYNNVYVPLRKSENQTGIVAESLAPVYLSFRDGTLVSEEKK